MQTISFADCTERHCHVNITAIETVVQNLVVDKLLPVNCVYWFIARP